MFSGDTRSPVVAHSLESTLVDRGQVFLLGRSPMWLLLPPCIFAQTLNGRA